MTAAQDKCRVSGLTHNFYRYPARFSPEFARAVINNMSEPGDIILDPYMGGGTTIVEALAAGRNAYGVDLNALAVFITRVKTTFLSKRNAEEIWDWVERSCKAMTFRAKDPRIERVLDDDKLVNMTLPKARPIKKAIASAMVEISPYFDDRTQNFIRCVLLRTGQWALDGRTHVPSLDEVRLKVRLFTAEMLRSLDELRITHADHSEGKITCRLLESDTATVNAQTVFRNNAKKADLIVTSPPYPGLHVLYHRWQINGRRETPAPYWIANCHNGRGATFYNFSDRKGVGLEKYFRVSLNTLKSIRPLIRDGGMIVQLIAFSHPEEQLPIYLENMKTAGFKEIIPHGKSSDRIWRDVPSRKWHATLKGHTGGSKEVLLVHQAV